MKTWDMLEILAKYPEKKFNNKAFGQVELFGSILVWSSNMEDVVISNTLLKMEWEEVKKPVSFIEAVESKKKIRVEHSYLDGNLETLTTNYYDLDDVLYEIGNYISDDGCGDIILNGKWYIED